METCFFFTPGYRLLKQNICQDRLGTNIGKLENRRFYRLARERQAVSAAAVAAAKQKEAVEARAAEAAAAAEEAASLTRQTSAARRAEAEAEAEAARALALGLERSATIERAAAEAEEQRRRRRMFLLQGEQVGSPRTVWSARQMTDLSKAGLDQVVKGQPVTVLTQTGVWRDCRVVEREELRGAVKVHYEGFDPTWDEWLLPAECEERMKPRLRSAGTGSNDGRPGYHDGTALRMNQGAAAADAAADDDTAPSSPSMGLMVPTVSSVSSGSSDVFLTPRSTLSSDDGDPAAAAAQSEPEPEGSPAPVAGLDRMLEMGWGRQVAQSALAHAGGDVNAAVSLLLQGFNDTATDATPMAAASTVSHQPQSQQHQQHQQQQEGLSSPSDDDDLCTIRCGNATQSIAPFYVLCETPSSFIFTKTGSGQTQEENRVAAGCWQKRRLSPPASRGSP